MRNKTSRPRREFDDEEDGGFLPEERGRRPGTPIDDADPLWTIYAINPGLPTRVKIEKLMVMWELDTPEIASVLSLDEEGVQSEVDRIKKDWSALGEELGDDELQMARGKMIKELLQHKSELEGLGPTQDQQIIKLKIMLTEKIAKLRGLERERKSSEEQDTGDLIADGLAHMTPDSYRNLLARLDKA